MSEEEHTPDEETEEREADLDVPPEEAREVRGGGTDDEDLDQLQVQR